MGSLKGAADQTSRFRGIEVAGNVAPRAHVRQGKAALDARIDHGGAARRLVEMSEEEWVTPTAAKARPAARVSGALLVAESTR
jgi:hypothetical protein